MALLLLGLLATCGPAAGTITSINASRTQQTKQVNISLPAKAGLTWDVS